MRPSFRLCITSSWLALAVLAAPACSVETPSDEPTGDEGESDVTSAARLNLPDETAPASTRAALSLDGEAADNRAFLDIRGVGDAGWSESKRPLPATFGEALDKFGTAYRGDLSFINWETVVGTRCDAWGSASFYFLSHPDNLDQMYARGFNLIGLANNHARDCARGPNAEGRPSSGELMTASFMRAKSEGKTWLWGGVGEGDPTEVASQTFTVKGKRITVAMGSGYFGSARSCANSVCANQVDTAMRKVLATRADIRIFALHCMEVGSPTYCGSELTDAGQKFLRLGGDVVFGHGPHVWRPVYVVRKDAGTSTNASTTGVMFQSLGNFAHPALSDQTKNLLGRALFDLDDLSLAQVQVVPVRNFREGTAPNRQGRAAFSSPPLTEVEGNLKFTPHPGKAGAGFANVKP